MGLVLAVAVAVVAAGLVAFSWSRQSRALGKELFLVQAAARSREVATATHILKLGQMPCLALRGFTAQGSPCSTGKAGRAFLLSGSGQPTIKATSTYK